MTTGKALNGKPYAGNPHVRFDEGEVASAATPRRGSLLYTRKTISKVVGVAALSLAMISVRASDVSYWFEGATLHVRATSALAGKGLFLQADAENTGEWTTATNFVTAVPTVGGEYAIDLTALGIGNGTSCRIVSATIYERLDKLLMDDTTQYINTGVKGKDVYGVRFGFYPTGKSGTATSDLYAAIDCGKDNGTGNVANRGGFLVCVAASAELSRFRFIWRGQSYDKGDNKVDTTAINEYAFTNRMCTLNGELQQSNLAAGAISTNEHNVFLGKCSYTTYSLHGWWSHVSLDDENGDKLLDYIPVRRVSDGKVGFWNSVGDGSFVASTGSGNFTAGTPTGENLVVGLTVVESNIQPNRILVVSQDVSSLTVNVPAGLAGERLIVAWDSEDKGCVLDDWAHSATLEESAVSGNVVRNIGALGIHNGDYVRVFAAHYYKQLDMLQMTSVQTYVNTRVLGKDVYGVRLGFYPTGKSGTATSDLYAAIDCGKDNGTGNVANRGGFLVCVAASAELSRFRFIWRGQSYDKGDNKVDTTAINEYAFTNRICTLNGELQQSNLAAGAISTNNHSVFLGKCSYTTYSLYGWWSHVSFDDKDGYKVLDYVPVQRVADGKVGFYDRATLSFVTSTGTGNFTAGTVADDTPVVAVNAVSRALTVSGIPGLLIIVK